MEGRNSPDRPSDQGASLVDHSMSSPRHSPPPRSKPNKYSSLSHPIPQPDADFQDQHGGSVINGTPTGAPPMGRQLQSDIHTRTLSDPSADPDVTRNRFSSAGSAFHSPSPLQKTNSVGNLTNSTSTYNSYSYSDSNISVASTSSNVSALRRRSRLTVEGDWRVDVALKERYGAQEGGLVALPVMKWVVTVLMAAAILVALVSAKTALLVLARLLNEARDRYHSDRATSSWTRYSAMFIMMYFVISLPAAFNMLRAFWFGVLDKAVPWPRPKSILLTVINAAVEAVGLCLMCYSVLGYYEAPVSLLILATPLVLPSIDNLRLTFTLHRRQLVSTLPVILSFVGVLSCVAGLSLTIYLMTATATIVADVWRVAVAVVTLSVAWLPCFLRRLSLSDDASALRAQDRDNAMQNSPLTASDHDDTERQFADGDVTLDVVDKQVIFLPAVWKAAFVLHACKLVFIFIVSFFIYSFDSGISVSQVYSSVNREGFREAWNLANVIDGQAALVAISVTLTTGCAVYALSFFACHIHIMRGALVPPLVLNIGVALLLLLVQPLCDSIVGVVCNSNKDVIVAFVFAAIFFALAHLGFTWRLFYSDPVLLLQENKVFLMPGYSGAAQDTTILLNARPIMTSMSGETRRTSKERTKIYICTTMYREEEEEMRQLLESINLINKAQAEGERCFESHIVFDGGVKQRELSEFALVLVSLLESTLGIKPSHCTKIVTPYGLRLNWSLPVEGPGKKSMPFSIHLKDNYLVKNKKRWSQVMYMSYVLDFLEQEDEESFILTTDADVVFTPDSVEALLDLMTRDQSIGAVCARTHPMGVGPLVWYQVFEYAIGHWFQKAAEHVLGSVLCAPGCFSVFRCRALADVLPKYSRRVETPFDFLTKDMGEDRWLCTLMVQSGWRIEYCAAAENSTNCPSQFEEFYKQRRRWIASTLANLMLIVQEWRYVRMLNYGVPVIFLMYQGLLLFSTLIGPSTIILVVSGGLWYAWAIDAITSVILQFMVCVAFAIFCLYVSQQTQLTVAKVYTFLYAIVMTAVVVGTAVQIVTDIETGTTQSSAQSNGSQSTTTTIGPPSEHISIDIPVSVATLYFGGLVGIFLLAALLHPREAYCLAHGVWYLLCLPSGYLVLTIYSICNITDSSWGTREQSEVMSTVKNVSWKKRVRKLLEEIFFCCNKNASKVATHDIEVQTYATPARLPSIPEDPPSPTSSRDHQADIFPFTGYDEQSADDTDSELSPEYVPLPVEDWLPPELQGPYVELFKRHGFDSTLFIAGMTETELNRIGVTSRGHLHYLQAQIALIPAFEIEYKVPVSVNEWLTEIGLSMYRDNFRRKLIRGPKDMEILKSFSRKDIERELLITKDGHIKRLMYAISKLRDPTERQQKAMRMRQMLDDVPIHYLKDTTVDENSFWEKLRKVCLEPDLKAFGLEGEVKQKLAELRNNWLVILGVSNTIWLILISTVASKSELTVLGANPLGVSFLFVFGLLFIIQFLTMLVHRLTTVSHYIARAPYRCGRPLKTTWSFKGGSGEKALEDSADIFALQQTALGQRASDARLRGRKRKSRQPSPSALGVVDERADEQADESTPLI